MIDALELQKLRDLPIEEVAERLGMEVKMHKALCPFHDDHHASLSFSVRRNTYRCFVCGEHGDTISLVMKRLNKPFCDACRWLSDGNGNVNGNYKPLTSNPSTLTSNPSTLTSNPFDASRYERYFEHPWLSDEARRFLFEERRLDERVVSWCRLTSWRDRRGVPWLQIPYYSREGKLIGVQNRNLVKGGQPRFRFPTGSECSIYNLPVLRRLKPGDELWITEGCSDCWAMLSSGRKAIAIPSATLLKREQLIELTGTGTFPLSLNMYPDRDEPGERLFMQLKELLPSLQHHQLPPDCKDFGEYYVKTLPCPPLKGGNG
jgi:DNA primase